MFLRISLAVSLFFLCVTDTSADQINQWRQSHEQQIVDQFAELLSIPNVAADKTNIRKNANHISQLMKDAGMSVELLELEGSNPVIFAEKNTPGATKTLMIYIHYDGQPVNPDNWASDPWVPVMRTDMVEKGGKPVPMKAPFDPDWRIFARSAGDDKAPIIALRSALLAMQASGIAPTVNLKVFMEGEEEAGSPNLRRMLEAYKDKLAADMWLFCDGPAHQSRRWQLVYGVRGSDGFNLTVYGSNRPLHSGHYGNWAPNPIVSLTNLIGSMRSTNGDVGAKARNVIPTEASASIGIRLVPAQTPDYLRGVIEKHIEAQGFYIIHDEPTPEQRRDHDKIARIDWDTSGGYPAYRAAFDHPLAMQISDILDKLSDRTLIQTPTMGGSLPLYVVEDVLSVPILILPIANHDNNQHGANENLRLQNLWDAIEIYAAVLSGL